MQQLVKEFNDTHKAVRVQLVGQSSDAYTEAMTLSFQSRQAPDVFLIGGLGQLLIAQHWSLPLNNAISPTTLATYRPYFLNGENSYKGLVYAIPTEAQTSRLMYNRDLFRAAGLDPDKPPTTFSEVLTDARKITNASHGAAFGFGMPMKGGTFLQWNIDPLTLTTIPHLTRQGLFNTTTRTYEMQRYQPVVELYRTLVKNGWVYPGPGSLDPDLGRSAFARGKIGMMIGASFDLKVINTQFKSKMDWSAAPLPIPDGQRFVQSPSYNGLAYAISAYTQYPQAAAQVVEYLVSLPVIQRLERAGEINALLPAAHTAAFLPQNAQGFSGFVPTPQDVPVGNGPGSLLRIQGKTYGGTISKLILDDEPIQPALVNLNQQYNAAFQRGLSDGSLNAAFFTQP